MSGEKSSDILFYLIFNPREAVSQLEVNQFFVNHP